NAPEEKLREIVHANTPDQALFVSENLLLTGRVMIKDEDVCLHCGLCAERCPTSAWDMQEALIKIHHAGDQLDAKNREAAE
ncbi:MAG TPA: glutamate synthase, partial [Hellea balneolensis]|nr:glutamate synthase [Hellea balneolensis]